MSLATRCTSCGTVFRVVQDQLKVSEGWVRCGRCNEVFNALEGLFDLERDATSAWAQLAAEPAPAPAPALPSDEANDEAYRDPLLVDKIDAQLLSPRRSGFGALAGLAPAERRHEDFADARFDTHPPAEDSAGDLSVASLGEARIAPNVVIDSDPDTGADPVDAPEFVRAAERQERWRGSRARSWLAVAALLLLLGLLGQLGHHQRDRLAAQWPATRPALAAWCAAVGCTIGAPRRIDDIVVESTSLTRAAVPDAFRLAVVVRNRSALPLAMPWVDLSLTDAAGQLVARRALAPQDFRVASNTLGAGTELGLQAVLAVGTGRVTGYTVEIFYP
jgi:predicted Zn finger-like uncharacterized protein